MLGYKPQFPKIPISTILGKDVVIGGVKNAIAHYREIKNTAPEKYDFGETQLNILGYQLLSNSRLGDAIEIFKLNVEMFPHAFNTYDSLGETYMNAGNKELAIENYKKSLELNPDNENAKKMLQQLQK
jgi:tetratricopeptide (TPR) repeat protein